MAGGWPRVLLPLTAVLCLSRVTDFLQTCSEETVPSSVTEPELALTSLRLFNGLKSCNEGSCSLFHQSISLDEFKSFCRFTTHLEDFAIAMQMFSLAHRPVRLGKFREWFGVCLLGQRHPGTPAMEPLPSLSDWPSDSPREGSAFTAAKAHLRWCRSLLLCILPREGGGNI